MSFKTASAILRGRWFIDKQWATAHMPVIASVLKGTGNFSGLFDKPQEEKELTEAAKQPKQILAGAKLTSVYGVNNYSDLSRLPSGSIAMLDITGPVTKYGDMCAWGSVDHTATINRLANAPNVSAIILNIDSPGGEAAGTAMLADAIKQASAQKPVVAMVDDGIAASAAMWVASAAQEIYTTQKTDMVGSVGVYQTVADWYGYFEEQGLKVRDIYAPQSIDKNQDYYEAIAGNDDPLKAELKVLADEFINTVAKNRGSRLTSNEWNTGKMYYTKDAIKIGLIDGQKSFTQVVRRVNSLIQSQSSNSNNMAFEKTLKVAGAQSFEVVEGGFLLEESHLNAIEKSIDDNATSLATANEQLTTANASLETSNGQLATAQADLSTANTALATAQARVTELEALSGQSAKTGKGADAFDKTPDMKKYETKYDKMFS